MNNNFSNDISEALEPETSRIIRQYNNEKKNWDDMKKKLELKIIEFEKILENSKHNELKLKNLNKELISKLTQINIQQESIEEIIENSSANLKKSNDSKKNNEIDQKNEQLKKQILQYEQEIIEYEKKRLIELENLEEILKRTENEKKILENQSKNKRNSQILFNYSKQDEFNKLKKRNYEEEENLRIESTKKIKELKKNFNKEKQNLLQKIKNLKEIKSKFIYQEDSSDNEYSEINNFTIKYKEIDINEQYDQTIEENRLLKERLENLVSFKKTNENLEISKNIKKKEEKNHISNLLENNNEKNIKEENKQINNYNNNLEKKISEKIQEKKYDDRYSEFNYKTPQSEKYSYKETIIKHENKSVNKYPQTENKIDRNYIYNKYLFNSDKKTNISEKSEQETYLFSSKNKKNGYYFKYNQNDNISKSNNKYDETNEKIEISEEYVIIKNLIREKEELKKKIEFLETKIASNEENSNFLLIERQTLIEKLNSMKINNNEILKNMFHNKEKTMRKEIKYLIKKLFKEKNKYKATILKKIK